MKKRLLKMSFIWIIGVAVLLGKPAVNNATIYAEDDEELYSFIPVDLPGNAFGINDTGEIVGYITYPNSDTYCSSNVYSCVYRYSNEGLDIIEFPGAEYSEGYDINNAGDIAGNYCQETTGSCWGFVYSDEDGYTHIAPIGSKYTWIWGINNLGEIVGESFAEDYNVDRHSFLLDEDEEFSVLSYSYIEAKDINDIGEIVFNEGYLLSEGNFINIDLYGPQGINNAGEIINYYGFLRYRDGSTINVEVPGFQNTYGCAINNKGEILLKANNGTGSKDHYFIAKPILGQVIEHSGDVSLSGNPAETGDPIHAGDLVEVGEGGLAAFKIRLKEKVQDLDKNLYVDSNSEVRIENKSTTSEIMLELFKGRLRGKVRELPEGILYDVKTPVCVIAVRGTEFLIEANEPNTVVTVLEDSVEVSSLDGEQRVILEENYELQATSEGLGEPYPIDPDEIDDWWNSKWYIYLSTIMK